MLISVFLSLLNFGNTTSLKKRVQRHKFDCGFSAPAQNGSALCSESGCLCPGRSEAFSLELPRAGEGEGAGKQAGHQRVSSLAWEGAHCLLLWAEAM